MDRPVGAFSVDPHGQANYHYPIEVPPGIGHGNEPKLSLNYYQSNTSNGILGAKWSLGGLSSIFLMPPTRSVDLISYPANGIDPATGIDVGFRYALDGAELLCTSGVYAQVNSQYMHELDAGSCRTVHLTSNGFIVVDQFGNRQDYGTTDDSRVVVQSPSGPTTTIEWKLKRDYDIRGNYVQYNYTTQPTMDHTSSTGTMSDGSASTVLMGDHAMSYIDSIQYSSNDRNNYTGLMRVQFLYSHRSDPVLTASWEGTVCTANVLTTIATSVFFDSVSYPARSYTVVYAQSPATGDSLIASITERGSLGTALNPTTFEYSGTEAADWDNMFSQGPTSSLPGTTQAIGLLPVSMTGRAYADLVCVQSNKSFGSSDVSLIPFTADPTSTTVGSDQSIEWSPLAGKNANCLIARAASNGSGDPQISLVVTDVDRDGRTDVIMPYLDTGNGLKFAIGSSTGNGFTTSLVDTNQSWQTTDKFFALDVNGDGTIDVIHIQSKDQFTHQVWTHFDILSSVGVDPTEQPVYQSVELADKDATINWVPVRLTKSNTIGLVQITEDSNILTGITTVSATLLTPNDPSNAGSSSTSPFSKRAFQRATVPASPLLEYETASQPDVVSVLAIDVNGDGIEDIVACSCKSSHALGVWSLKFTFQSCLFSGSAFGAQNETTSYTLQVAQPTTAPNPGKFYVMNLDGSRYPCIVYVYDEADNSVSAMFGMGSSTGQINAVYYTPLATEPPIGKWTLVPTDVNCVGRGGFILYTTSPNTGIYNMCPVYNVNKVSDNLTVVTNPMGLRQEIAYSPLSAPGVYQGPLSTDTNTPIPGNVSILGSSAYLVTDLLTYNDPFVNALDIGGTGETSGRHTAFSYKLGNMNTQGRGWMGFEVVVQFDTKSGVRTESTYDVGLSSSNASGGPGWATAGKLTKLEIYGSQSSDTIARLTSWPALYVSSEKLLLRQQTVSSYQVNTYDNDRKAPVLFTTLTRTAQITVDEPDDGQDSSSSSYQYCPGTNLQTMELRTEFPDQDSSPPLYKKRFYDIFALPASNFGLQSDVQIRVPIASKVTVVAANENAGVFEVGDLSMKTFQYDEANVTLISVSTLDTNDGFMRKACEFDGYGNTIVQKSLSLLDSIDVPTTYTPYDPIFHTFPISDSLISGSDEHNAETRYAVDPRYGTRILSRSAYGDVVVSLKDEWGREIQKLLLDIDQKNPSSDSVTLQSLLPPCSVMDPTIMTNLSVSRCVPSETTSYEVWPNNLPQTPTYMYRSKIKYNDQNTSKESPAKEYVDAEGNVRKTQSQGCATQYLAPISWQYREYNSHSQMILQSYPTDIGDADGLDWIPAYQDCCVFLFDALQRPLLSVRPPDVPGGPFVSTESCYSDGGNAIARIVRQSKTFLYSQTDPEFENTMHEFRKFDGKWLPNKLSRETSLLKYDYDALGRLVSILDGGNRTESRTYNGFGQLVTIDNHYQNPIGAPNTFGIQKKYDEFGFLHTETNAMNETTTFTFDVMHRLREKLDYSGTTWTYTYDPNGSDKLSNASFALSSGGDPVYHFDYEYDVRGLKSKETLTHSKLGTFSTLYTYDRQGHITNKTLPDSTQLAYSWDGPYLVTISMRSSLDTAEGSWQLLANCSSYSVAGLPLDYTLSSPQDLGAGSSTDRWTTSYDLQDRPLTVLHGSQYPNGSSDVTCAYQYDCLGQLLSSTDTNEPATPKTYQYVDRRLSSSTYASKTQNYTYDGSGTLTSKAGVALNYSKTSKGAQLQAIANGDAVYTYTYDGAGRVLSRVTKGRGSFGMWYDGQGKMTLYSLSGAVGANLFYDHEGSTLCKMHYDKTNEIFCGNDFHLLIGADGGRTVKRKIFAFGKILATITAEFPTTGPQPSHPTLTTYMTDHKGTIIYAYSGGPVGRKFSYDDWGLLLSPSPTDADMSTTYEEDKLYDDITGFIDFNGRWYDPIIGRFTTPDWNFDQSLMTQQDCTNLYAFEGNNPINQIDPSGHINWNFVGGMVIGVVAVGVGIGLTIATGGAGTVLMAVAIGALTGGGGAAIVFSISNRDELNPGKFWKGWGVAIAIGVVSGAITGGVGQVITNTLAVSAATIDQAAFNLALNRLGGLEVTNKTVGLVLGIGGKMLLNGTMNVVSTVSDIAAENGVMGKNDPITAQLVVRSAILGMIFAGSKGTSKAFLNKGLILDKMKGTIGTGFNTAVGTAARATLKAEGKMLAQSARQYIENRTDSLYELGITQLGAA